MSGDRTPEERWRDHLLKQYRSFRGSPDWLRLKERGLAILGREHQVTSAELWEFTSSLGDRGDEYVAYIHECKEVAEKFGLSAGTVVHACLVHGYHPEASQLPIGLPGVKVVVVVDTDTSDPFFRNLHKHASDLNLVVQARDGKIPPSRSGFRMRGDQVIETFPIWPMTELSPEQIPPLSKAFKMQVESLPGVPHEIVAETAREAAQLGDELGRRLGYPIKQRMRLRSVSRKD
jgi:hypothetical protein